MGHFVAERNHDRSPSNIDVEMPKRTDQILSHQQIIQGM